MRLLACCLIAVLALLPVPARADRLDEIKAQGVVRVVTVREPPFLVRGGKAPEGFVAEVGGRLARDLGVKLEVKVASPKNLARRVRESKAHLAAGGFPAGDPASLGLALSPPIARHRVELITRSPGEAAGRQAVAAAPIVFLPASAAVAGAAYPEARLWRLRSMPEVFQALTLGTASAAILGPPWPALILAQNPATFAAAGEPVADTETVLASPAGETRLAEYVAQWVRAAEADGFLADRRRYWFEGGEWLPRGACAGLKLPGAASGAPAPC